MEESSGAEVITGVVVRDCVARMSHVVRLMEASPAPEDEGWRIWWLTEIECLKIQAGQLRKVARLCG